MQNRKRSGEVRQPLAQEYSQSAMARVAAASRADIIGKNLVVSNVVEQPCAAPSAARAFTSRRRNQIERTDQDVAELIRVVAGNRRAAHLPEPAYFPM